MPQNMQKKPQVAELELDDMMDMTTDELEPPSRTLNVEAMAAEHPVYQAALDLLKHGYKPKQIAKKLLEKGVVATMPQASRLALKVAKENPEEQHTNARILYGVSALVASVGMVFVGFRWLAGDYSVSSAYVLFLIAAWFAYQGYQSQNASKKK